MEKNKTEKVKNGKIKKILIAVFVTLLSLCLVVFAFVWNKLDLLQTDEDIQKIDASVSESEEPKEDIILSEDDIKDLTMINTKPVIPDMEIYEDKNVVNILLIGTDERVKHFSTNARSDSMIILSINKEKHTVKLVSLERGMGVPILEGQYKGQYDWLTHVFRYGGADLLMKTVETCFRVKVDRYIRVNFNTFIQIVDSIGGVDINLTEAEANYMIGQKYNVVPGPNKLDGKEALSYSRIRKIDSDWSRVVRQRNVIQSAFIAAKELSLVELNKMANDILPLIQTNLTKGEIAALILESPNLVGKELEQMTIPKKGNLWWNERNGRQKPFCG
ncbi:MAG: LCP family protein [Ruminococcaceae bacterium]|nr:LCP family protein [Oscillospiraceae bacterium]